MQRLIASGFHHFATVTVCRQIRVRFFSPLSKPDDIFQIKNNQVELRRTMPHHASVLIPF